MKIIIRSMKLHDINQIIVINEGAMAEHYPKESWVCKFYEGKSHSFVAISAGMVIGYIACSASYIVSFAVDSKFRGHGIGRQLLYHCLNTFESPVYLHARVNNATALRLYQSLNFIVRETLHDYYVSPIEDAYLMEWKPSPGSGGMSTKCTDKINITAQIVP